MAPPLKNPDWRRRLAALELASTNDVRPGGYAAPPVDPSLINTAPMLAALGPQNDARPLEPVASTIPSFVEDKPADVPGLINPKVPLQSPHRNTARWAQGLTALFGLVATAVNKTADGGIPTLAAAMQGATAGAGRAGAEMDEDFQTRSRAYEAGVRHDSTVRATEGRRQQAEEERRRREQAADARRAEATRRALERDAAADARRREEDTEGDETRARSDARGQATALLNGGVFTPETQQLLEASGMAPSAARSLIAGREAEWNEREAREDASEGRARRSEARAVESAGRARASSSRTRRRQAASDEEEHPLAGLGGTTVGELRRAVTDLEGKDNMTPSDLRNLAELRRSLAAAEAQVRARRGRQPAAAGTTALEETEAYHADRAALETEPGLDGGPPLYDVDELMADDGRISFDEINAAYEAVIAGELEIEDYQALLEAYNSQDGGAGGEFFDDVYENYRR